LSGGALVPAGSSFVDALSRHLDHRFSEQFLIRRISPDRAHDNPALFSGIGFFAW
jgi:hypothetical protein